MDNDSIVVYWSPGYNADIQDWTFLYPKPKTLFSSVKTHISDKNNQVSMEKTSAILACPAISTKFKKIAVFESPMSCSYTYDFSKFSETGNGFINNESKEYISCNVERQPTLDHGPSITFALSYILFSEEPLDAYFTPPMFHKPKYMKYGSVIPGEFNIGKWFRPFNFEVQMWNNSGEFFIENGEPLFYTEFKTNKKIILKRFIMTEKLYQASKACVDSYTLFGYGQTLEERYDRFTNTDMKDLILNEIKKNVVEESAPIEI
jgi:hypothetical protein